MLLVWLEFIGCAAVIWIAGVRLSHYGDLIAQKSGASRTWIGVILLASVTSLPELVTGVSAVGLANAPDIAIGDVLGSCVFNLLLLTFVDFLHRHEPVYTRASHGHILSAGFGVILLGFVAFNIVLAELGRATRIGHVGASSLILIALYLLAVRTVFRYEQEHHIVPHEEPSATESEMTLRQVQIRYAAWSLLVVAGGVALPFVGVGMAEAMGWEKSFVGNLFIAFATSLPEVVVTSAAVRMGALDLAIGNLFGSNLFNLMILAIDDLMYRPGPLLEHGSPIHSVSALSAVMMTGIAIVGLLYRPRTRMFRTVGWASLLLFSIYLLNAYFLSLYRR